METGDRYKTFENRREAAELLIPLLQDLKELNPLILAIPRGAVPMAQTVAQALQAEMDLVLVKKIKHPHHHEFAIGAVTESGEILLSSGAQEMNPKEIEASALAEIQKLQRQRLRYTGTEHAHAIEGRTVIIVDDGIATGSTMAAAIQSLQAQKAKRIVVAAPVASHESIRRLENQGAEVRVYYVPQFFGAVSYFYNNFDQVSDAEVGEFFQLRSFDINISAVDQHVTLKAILGRPRHPKGLIIFSHGSGSGRLSPRNQFVADLLNRQGYATILADLLTEQESHNRANVFDISLLSKRLISITNWALRHPELKSLPIGYFGASTGAASALVAASRLPRFVQAVVSRGGRPDLALASLRDVKCATLLLVGSEDHEVLAFNQAAFKDLRNPKTLDIIEGATHLFEEPGKLEEVAEKALNWFDAKMHPKKESRPTPNNRDQTVRI